MPARCGRKIDESVARKAAALYLDEGVSVGAVAERFGMSRGAVSAAVARLRKERGITGPSGGDNG